MIDLQVGSNPVSGTDLPGVYINSKQWIDKFYVPTDKEWRVMLNADVDPSTVNEQNILVYDTDKNLLDVAVSVEQGKTIVVKPLQNYMDAKTYYLVIGTGLKSITGEALTKPVIMRFLLNQPVDAFTPQWVAVAHSEIILNAAQILKLKYNFDMVERIRNRANSKRILFKLTTDDVKKALKEAANKPDEDLSEIGKLWRGHFYEPVTEMNWDETKDPTAYTNFKEHALEAKKLWKKNDYEDAVEELGMAVHYLADMGAPHHVSNRIANIDFPAYEAKKSNHTEFETYVDEHVMDTISVTSSRDYDSSFITNLVSKYSGHEFKDSYDPDAWFFRGSNKKEYFYHVSQDSAKYAKSKMTSAQMSKDRKDEARYGDEWMSIAKATIPKSQERVAAFLYRFFKEVGEI
ncbi:Ig-like domain-containing protein [Thermincola ferriacetica]